MKKAENKCWKLETSQALDVLFLEFLFAILFSYDSRKIDLDTGKERTDQSSNTLRSLTSKLRTESCRHHTEHFYILVDVFWRQQPVVEQADEVSDEISF